MTTTTGSAVNLAFLLRPAPNPPERRRRGGRWPVGCVSTAAAPGGCRDTPRRCTRPTRIPVDAVDERGRPSRTSSHCTKRGQVGLQRGDGDQTGGNHFGNPPLQGLGPPPPAFIEFEEEFVVPGRGGLDRSRAGTDVSPAGPGREIRCKRIPPASVDRRRLSQANRHVRVRRRA